jgi:hypothetical protein
MRHRPLYSLRLALALCGAPLAAAFAQTGFVSLQLHGITGPDATVYRTWIQGPSGLQEIFTQEFTPGTHTLAKVEGVYGPCRAVATNVTFTIVANKWTIVDVPVAWTDCALSVDISLLGGHLAGGTGKATVATASSSGGAPTVATCHSAVTGSAVMTYVDFHACHGTIAYGATGTLTLAPDAGSCCDEGPDSFTVNFAQVNYIPQGASFIDNMGVGAPEQHFNADLSVELVNSSYGGQTMSSTFRVVNHGPHNALNVSLVPLGDSLEDQDAQVAWSASDGNCYTYPLNGSPCVVGILPAGDSTTFTVRYSGGPSGDPNAPPPTLTQFCVGVQIFSYNAPYSDDPPPDNNPSNNKAPCILHSLPVTVALGGSSPANQVVQKGSTSVPMLEFALTPASLANLDNVTIKAQGSGNEQVDVTAVRIYLDKNGDGLVNGTDSVLASGAFAANDGSVTLTLNPAYAITAPVNILVTYDFSTTLAQRLGGGAALAVLPLLLVPAMRRRRRLAMLALLMVCGVTVASCGSSSTGPGGTSSSTYQATLTGITASGFSKSDLSLSGATITIDK